MKKIKGNNNLKKRRIRTSKKYIKIKYNKKFQKKKKNNFIKYLILLIKLLFIIIILYIIYYKIILYYKQNKFCIDCSKNIDNINSKCRECS